MSLPIVASAVGSGLEERWAPSSDLPHALVLAVLAAAALGLALLVLELVRTGRRTRVAVSLVLVSGAAALALLVTAVLRPVRVHERAIELGASVVVLADGSRSMDLREGDGTRRQRLEAALTALDARFAKLRTRRLAFGRGAAVPLDVPSRGASSPKGPLAVLPATSSDLHAALESIVDGSGELPRAIVVVSDGRLDRPGPSELEAQLRAALGGVAVPIHTVYVATDDPRDATLRSVRIADAVVAHQPSTLTVEVACTGGLECDKLPLRVYELFSDEPPVERASGVAHVDSGRAELTLEVTLDRAGKRILEVELDAPVGDTIPENNRRFITVDVARDRVRLLHVAGRPTYDVRALRSWLKSDVSADVVAFFILRTRTDDVAAAQDELALIPFPVDELFTRHLQSFDAVILQDFDAEPYGLSVHLVRLAEYVRQGGGLIMVGGPNAFVAGNYASTPLAKVLPVGLEGIAADRAVDLASFAPTITKAGRRSPVLEALLGLVGEGLPAMPGTNVVASARDGATVLLAHPTLRVASGAAMPVLALGEFGSGRSVALTVDGSHLLQFGTFAADAGGRAHGALWDALLGWLMRDARFEPAVVELDGGCIAGLSATLRLRAVFGDEPVDAHLTVASMGNGAIVRTESVRLDPDAPATAAVRLGALAPGGYTATVRLDHGGGSAPSRYDFACEVGGDEWADPRPDVERLRAISAHTGGVSVDPADVRSIPTPSASRVVSERRVEPLLPPWGWTLGAAVALGAHWIARRKAGLA